MLINVDNFVKGDSMPVNFSGSLQIPEEYSKNRDVSFDLNATIANTGKEYYLTGNVKAVLNLNCDLCLEPFSFELLCDIEEIFVKSNDEESEAWFFSDNIIDIEPAIVSNILLNMPMKVVCSNECKGLCPSCGHNLNDGDCGCNITYINPKFEMLRTLFNDKEV